MQKRKKQFERFAINLSANQAEALRIYSTNTGIKISPAVRNAVDYWLLLMTRDYPEFFTGDLFKESPRKKRK